jgi:hypothetical protein
MTEARWVWTVIMVSVFIGVANRSAQAVTNTWDNTSGDCLWATPSNWTNPPTADAKPGPTDQARFGKLGPQSTTYTVTNNAPRAWRA